MQISSHKILIIEDDIDIQEALELVLNEENYDIVLKSNGAEAWEYLVKTNFIPDIILLDRNMPIMNGIEFRKKQMTSPQFFKIKTVLLSAQTLEPAFNELQFNAILKKPVDIEMLLEVIQNMCKEN